MFKIPKVERILPTDVQAEIDEKVRAFTYSKAWTNKHLHIAPEFRQVIINNYRNSLQARALEEIEDMIFGEDRYQELDGSPKASTL